MKLVNLLMNLLQSISRPSHTSLKSREKGQSTVEELSKRDFRRELEDREHEAQREKDDKRRQLDRHVGLQHLTLAGVFASCNPLGLTAFPRKRKGPFDLRVKK